MVSSAIKVCAYPEDHLYRKKKRMRREPGPEGEHHAPIAGSDALLLDNRDFSSRHGIPFVAFDKTLVLEVHPFLSPYLRIPTRNFPLPNTLRTTEQI